MLKYRRYVQDWRKKPGKQAAIIKEIAETEINYRITASEEERKQYIGEKEGTGIGIYGKTHKEAKRSAQKTRDLFVKYKNSGK